MEDKMETAKEMIKYIDENNLWTYGDGAKEKHRSSILTSLTSIEKKLSDNEKVITVFQMSFLTDVNAKKKGLPNDLVFNSTAAERTVCVITNTNIVFSLTAFIKSYYKSIKLDNVNDITIHKKNNQTIIRIDTISDQFTFAMSNHINNKNYAGQEDKIFKIMVDQINKNVDDSKSNTFSVLVADEIIKLKSLLDANVLTQEEFDAKKKQLLNL
jgi:hypothetical protein